MIDQDLINRYEAGPRQLREAVSGLSEQAMKSFPVAGSWSMQQLVLHLQDADLIMAERMKRIIAEEKPTLLAFNHDGFMAHLDSNVQSAADALTLIELQRKQMVAIFRNLPEEAFSRVGVHSQRGPMTLTAAIGFAISHLDHHMKFIAPKRAVLDRS